MREKKADLMIQRSCTASPSLHMIPGTICQHTPMVPPAQIVQEYYVTVSNAAEVSINLTGAGAAMLAEVAETRFQELTDVIQELTAMIQGLQRRQEADRADIDYIALMRGVDL